MSRTLVQLGIGSRESLIDARRCVGGAAELSMLVRSHALGLGVEAAILSTCERFEIYALADPREAESLAHTLWACVGSGGSPCDRRTGHGAVEHLFRVAAGLESRLLGEPEILGQVDAARSSLRHAKNGDAVVQDESSPDSRSLGVLDALFASAIRCGRRARSRTALGALASSSVDLTVSVLRESLDLPSSKLGVVGSGAVARDLVSKLLKLGVVLPTVLARHTERAEEAMLSQAAPRHAVRVLPLARLEETLPMLDALVTATSSPSCLVRTEMVRARAKPLLILDLGVPANVDDEVGEIPGVRVIGLDDLTPARKPVAEAVEHASVIASKAALVWTQRWLGSDADREGGRSLIVSSVEPLGAVRGVES